MNLNLRLRDFALWVIVVLALLVLFTLFQTPGPRPVSQDISFSQLLSEVDQGRVRDVVIEGPEIHGTFTDGRSFRTYAPNDPTLAQRLYGKGVIVTARPSQDTAQWATSLLISWLPFVVLVGVWIFLSRRMRTTGRVFGFGQSAALSDKVLADPKYWRDRVDEARTVAGHLGDHDSKRRMAEIAQGYEYLAQRAEERLRGLEK
jgi:cell division protease FtsH